ncbi:imelysin family protein [Marinobacter zhejiangensis]|uniref:Imelysin-like domain-containing protein n=1 Tax=Marinobacter zhejiangensis TaxID=488535 RepID=A0A1I4QF34_9GAMM|nr:imelysin family protein [Marinobacter zhejiangensis]SFM38386.1 hypothetical protein SAMN04487963_2344 [Marinobacter zhejiangensis]
MPSLVSLRPLRHYLLAMALFVTATSSQANEALTRLHQDIGHGYTQLSETSNALADSASAYCRAPTGENQAKLRENWREAFLSWQRVRFVDFGPIEQNSLAWQFQFWPDPKNLVASKVSFWLHQDGELTVNTIDTAGVAVQGFPALEYLLWEPTFLQSDQALPAARSCDLLTAISQHIARNAQTVTAGWYDMASYYESTDDYSATTIKAAMSAVEVIRDRRLGAPMGLRGNGRRNAYQADAWRSGLSLETIRASLEGLDTLFSPGLGMELDAAGASEIKQRLAARLTEALSNFDDLPDGMAPLLNGDGYNSLQALYIDLELLEQVLTDDVAPTLGVIRGFNSSDGD